MKPYEDTHRLKLVIGKWLSLAKTLPYPGDVRANAKAEAYLKAASELLDVPVGECEKLVNEKSDKDLLAGNFDI